MPARIRRPKLTAERLEDRTTPVIRAGSLDPTFGVGGRVVVGESVDPPLVSARADGGVALAGRDTYSSYSDKGGFTSYSSDLLSLSLDKFGDPVFYSSWVSSADIYYFQDYGSPADTVGLVAQAIQPDGAQVIGGNKDYASDGATRVVLARHAPGHLQSSTFGEYGEVELRLVDRSKFPVIGQDEYGDILDYGEETLGALAALKDGKILAVCHTELAGPAVVRLTSTGDLDPTFGDKGVVWFDPTPGDETFTRVAVRPDGRIVLGGKVKANGVTDAAVFGLTADGKMDPAFGDAGVAVTAPGAGGPDAVLGMRLLTDGRVVAAGQAEGKLYAARLAADGKTDATYGTGGAATATLTATGGTVRAAVVLPDGRVVAAGATGPDAAAETGLLRLTAAGELDPAFGAGGRAELDLTTSALGSGPTLSAVADGRVFVCAPEADDSAAVVARVLGTDLPDPPTIADIRDQKTVLVNSPVGPIKFTVGDDATPAGDLTVTATSSDPALVPAANIALGGSGGVRTITVTPAAGKTGKATITVSVTDGNGTTIRDKFTVNFIRPPEVYAVPDQPAVPAGTTVGPIRVYAYNPASPGEDLVVTATSSNPVLVPDANIAIRGPRFNRTVTITPAAGQTGTAVITLTTRTSLGYTDTETFTVTFTPPAGTNTPPTFTAPADPAAVTPGVAVGPLPFTVADGQTAAGQLTVAAASDNPTLVPVANIIVGGTGADRTVTVTPAAGASGSATITLTVTDAAGAAATASFTVTVTDPANPPPTVTNIPDQPAVPAGTPVGPLPFTVGDSGTAADQLTVTAVSSNPGLVPTANIVIGGSGADRTVTVTPAAGQSGTAAITLTVTDAGGATTTDTFTVTFTAAPPPPAGPKSVLVGYPQFAVGADAGGSGTTLYNPDRSVRLAADPFPGFAGGVRTAAADFNRDGVADLVAGTGPGRATRVVVLDGVTQKELFAVDPFEATFTGGVYVAAGDVTGDGIPDLVITPDEGGGPRCRVFDGANGFSVLADFFGIDDPDFRGGARASIGDVDGDGAGDLIVAAGFQGGPRVAGFSGPSLGSGSPARVFPDFFAFEQTLRNGTFVAAGDIDGDGKAEVIAGGGPGGGPRVTAFGGGGLLGGAFTPVANFFGGDEASRGGIRVAVKNLDGDAKADLVVGAGTGAGGRATAYYGKDIPAAGTPPVAFDLDAVPGFTGGVFVG